MTKACRGEGSWRVLAEVALLNTLVDTWVVGGCLMTLDDTWWCLMMLVMTFWISDTIGRTNNTNSRVTSQLKTFVKVTLELHKSIWSLISNISDGSEMWDLKSGLYAMRFSVFFATCKRFCLFKSNASVT